nr:hypothetical protein [Pararhizobium haloflavum]
MNADIGSLSVRSTLWFWIGATPSSKFNDVRRWVIHRIAATTVMPVDMTGPTFRFRMKQLSDRPGNLNALDANVIELPIVE